MAKKNRTNQTPDGYRLADPEGARQRAELRRSSAASRHADRRTRRVRTRRAARGRAICDQMG